MKKASKAKKKTAKRKNRAAKVPKRKARRRSRSAKSGEFVSTENARRHPSTTVTETDPG